MAEIIKVGARGQISLPRKIRAELSLSEGEQLTAEIDGESIILRRKARRFAEYLEKFGKR